MFKKDDRANAENPETTIVHHNWLHLSKNLDEKKKAVKT